MSTIGLRQATAADGEFCFQAHKAAMGGYIAAIWGWDEADQRDRHDRGFDPSRWQIITVDGAEAGLLIAEYRPDEVYLARIEIHPDHQGLGIGSYLVRRLINDAAARGQDVTLDVFAVNHRARAFYERHGFREVARHGENDIKIRMRSAGRIGGDGAHRPDRN